MKRFQPVIAMLALALLFIACNSGSFSSNMHEVRHMQLPKPDIATSASVAGEENKPLAKQKAFNTEDYDNIVENNFVTATQQPLSTFSIDVDRAAYANVRRFIESGSLPPRGAVRIEEMINYFDYRYEPPTGDDPFAVYTETATCPWNENHRLVQIGLQGKKISGTNLPPSNLVFLVDVSGSMDEPNKLPLVQESLKLLTDQLRKEDNVAIVVYAGRAGLVLPSVSGLEKTRIKQAIDDLGAGGSTAGGEGIELAYKIARENLKRNGNNRVILATDGDFNVGVSSDAGLTELIEKERNAGVFLSVLGFGMGNYKDNKMQQLADKGNGNHNYIDNMNEAKKVLVNEFGGTLFTIAKDVKIQVEFNPALVNAYRLIGYENRVMPNEDFNDDKKDAGELGAGHTVTALYEIIPAGLNDTLIKKIDDLKYQARKEITANDDELATVKLRYKQPTSDESKLLTFPVANNNNTWQSASGNFRFAAAVAEFGLLLRKSAFKQNSSFRQTLLLATNATENDEYGYRSAFVRLVQKAETFYDQTAAR